MLKGWIALICAIVLTAAGVVPAQPPPDIRSFLDGLDWVLIGDPGNPAFEGGAQGQLKGRGGIDYRFRLTRTEITVRQWFQFVQAFAPYYEGTYGQSFGLTGSFIYISGSLTDPDSYHMVEGAEDLPTNQSWRMAARYCNWLHNHKEQTKEAFAKGAYDTSTFTVNLDGTYNDQPTRSPGARYWIPSLDEWLKGVYYDRTLNHGHGGWWWHPGSSDEPLEAGFPWEHGQTNGSLFTGPPPPIEAIEAGAYPWIQSPWGLLDASGGMREWTEEFGNSNHSWRITKGSSFFSDGFSYQWEDGILTVLSAVAWHTAMEGVRLASAVPGVQYQPVLWDDN